MSEEWFKKKKQKKNMQVVKYEEYWKQLCLVQNIFWES